MSKQQTEAHNIFRNSLRNDIDLSKIRTLNANESKLDNNTSNQSEKPLFIKKERIQLPDRYTIKIDKKNYKQSYVLEPDKGIQPSRSYYNRGASSTAQKNNITKNYNTINDSSFPYNERLTTQKLQDQILKENNNFIKVVRRKDFNSYFHRKEYFLDTEERSLARKRSIDDLYRSNPFKETEGKANEAKLDGNTKGNERHRYVQDSMQMKQSFKDEAPIEAANYKITNNRNFIRSSSTGDIKEFKIDYAFGSRVNPSDLHCTKPDARENENVIRNRNLENSYNPIKYNKSRMTKDNRIYDNGTRSTKSNNSSNMKNIFNLEKGSSRNINYDKIFNQPLNKFSAPDSTDSTFRRKKAPLKYDNKCGYLMI